MRLVVPGRDGAPYRLSSTIDSTGKAGGGQPVVLTGPGGESFSIWPLEPDIVRVCHRLASKPQLERTWMIVDENGDMPYEGRSRDDLGRFGCPDYELSLDGASDRLSIDTGTLRIETTVSSPALSWFDAEGECFAEDLEERAYAFDRSGSVYHYMKRSPDMRFYGFGEKTGPLNKHGRRMRMFNLDAGRYNAELSDPLYKHFPFYITYLPESRCAYGLFYDNLATTVFDMGCEHHNFFPAYRYYQAEEGDLDYYMLYGPSIEAVLARLVSLTGRMTLPPRWSLGYLGSTMQYTEAENAQEELARFAGLCKEHEIPCDMFHLSSGYCKGEDGKRYVFEWNRKRVPEPSQMVRSFHDHGIKLVANVKPSLLTSHPRFDQVEELDGFVESAEGSGPQLDKFWDGDGAHLDFTTGSACQWWKDNLKEHILGWGIDGVWNDNNEYSIWDDDAIYRGFGESLRVGLAGRPLQTLLMARASHEALVEHEPERRPYVLTRSACPGIQRYAHTWTGDNDCNWHTLKFNIPMGLGLSLSGMPGIGHDVGGFFGNKPDPELFARWVANGIFHPRFTIHSWHDDGSVNEPWMYPEILPVIRDLICFRYSMIPYLYSLIFDAARSGRPVIRPLVYEFGDDSRCLDESFDFLLGSHWLVASVLEPGLRCRDVYLPSGSMWCDFDNGAWHGGGVTVTVEAPLSRIPTLVREGGLIPLGRPARQSAESPDDMRRVLAFPGPGEGHGRFSLIEDDGESMAYKNGGYSEIELFMDYTKERVNIGARILSNNFKPAYSELDWVFPPGESREIAGASRVYEDESGRLHAGLVIEEMGIQGVRK